MSGSFISRETEELVIKKLNNDQVFVIIVLIISAFLFYFTTNKMVTQIDGINSRLDRLIGLQEQNLLASQNTLGLGVTRK